MNEYREIWNKRYIQWILQVYIVTLEVLPRNSGHLGQKCILVLQIPTKCVVIKQKIIPPICAARHWTIVSSTSTKTPNAKKVVFLRVSPPSVIFRINWEIHWILPFLDLNPREIQMIWSLKLQPGRNFKMTIPVVDDIFLFTVFMGTTESRMIELTRENLCTIHSFAVFHWPSNLYWEEGTAQRQVLLTNSRK